MSHRDTINAIFPKGRMNKKHRPIPPEVYEHMSAMQRAEILAENKRLKCETTGVWDDMGICH